MPAGHKAPAQHPQQHRWLDTETCTEHTLKLLPRGLQRPIRPAPVMPTGRCARCSALTALGYSGLSGVNVVLSTGSMRYAAPTRLSPALSMHHVVCLCSS